MTHPLIGFKCIAFLIICLFSCKKDAVIDPGNDPNFKIIAHNDDIHARFIKKVVVFGIDIYAVEAIEDEKLLHAANVMAQYLDNNEDAVIDDSLVHAKMIENQAFLVMWKKQRDLNMNFPSNRHGQDLGNDETHPSFVRNGKSGEFDASLEEVLHLIHHAGHVYAYPEAFGPSFNASLSKAMDIARGGQFIEVPETYPEGAWYTYDDETCEYVNCQTIEYMYWALTSILGAQENRLDEIGQEWKLNTKTKVADMDTAIYALLTNPIYSMPTQLPDGTYRH